MEERRTQQRLSIDRPAVVIQSTGEPVTCRAVSISTAGITLRCAYPADIGSQFDIILDLTIEAHLQRLKLRGKVAYSTYDGDHDAFHLGMSLIKFYGDSRERLAKFCERH